MTSLGLVSSKGALAWRPSYNRVYSLPASVCLTRARRPDGYLGLPRGREVVCLLLSLGRRRWGGKRTWAPGAWVTGGARCKGQRCVHSARCGSQWTSEILCPLQSCHPGLMKVTWGQGCEDYSRLGAVVGPVRGGSHRQGNI